MSTLNIIGHVRHAWLDKYAVRVMRKKSKLSSDGGDSGSKKQTRVRLRLWWKLVESGVRRSGLCCCVWEECDFSRREGIVTFNLILQKFYKFCSFNTICKDYFAINCRVLLFNTKNFHSCQLWRVIQYASNFFFFHLRFVHSTVVFLHPKLSFAICLCL
jgi:hypothetical protein